MSANLNTSASFSTLSSSTSSYSPPTMPPPTPPRRQCHVSNLTGEQFFLYPTAFAAIKFRRACKHDTTTSAAAAETSETSETLTMIPLDLIETIAACRSPVPGTTSRVTGQKFHLFTTTNFGTIRLRRKCRVQKGYSVALANIAQALTMLPTELKEIIDLFRSPTLITRPPRRQTSPLRNLTDKPYQLHQSTGMATINLRRASLQQGPYAGAFEYLTMIPHAPIESLQRTSRVSILSRATDKRVQEREEAENQHPKRFVQQEGQFEDLTEWLRDCARPSPSPGPWSKGEGGESQIVCEQEEGGDDFEE